MGSHAGYGAAASHFGAYAKGRLIATLLGNY
jgi:hypothetical protein